MRRAVIELRGLPWESKPLSQRVPVLCLLNLVRHVCRADQILQESSSFSLDMDEESLQKWVFHSAVIEMMRMAGVDEFGLKDIYNPEPGRVTLILSAAIAFHKHRWARFRCFSNLALSRLPAYLIFLSFLRRVSPSFGLVVS